MKDALIVTALSVVPKNHAARFMGWSARRRLPGFLHRALVRWFVRRYQVNLDEAEGSIDDYSTLAEFFVRPLRAGARPVDPDPDVLVSPVDAMTHTVGRLEGGRLAQAAGMACSANDLLGEGVFDPARFEGGAYAVLYLSPRDYHRVHTPSEGRLLAWRYLPGRLWPVFPAATRRVEGLFDRNERLAFLLDTPAGLVAEVLVGAFGVGRMTSVLAPVTTNTTGVAEERRLDPPAAIDRAAEIGRFELGSTVILLAEPGRIEWTIRPGDPVRVGQAIARTTS